MSDNKFEHQQRLLNWLDTPEGQAAIKEHFAELDKEQEVRDKWLLEEKEIFDKMSDADFKKFVIEQNILQSRGYGVEMLKSIEAIWGVITTFGIKYRPKNWGMFAQGYWKYKGLYASVYCGQGECFIRIKCGKKTILQSP